MVTAQMGRLSLLVTTLSRHTFNDSLRSLLPPHAVPHALDATNALSDAEMVPSIVITLALALLSFLSSAFVILRITLPILPPNPLSRQVPPAEFGLPNYRRLTPADKSHLWLACLDLLALGFFVWQALSAGFLNSPTITHDPLSTSRLWIALTTRQACLFVIIAITLFYVRRGHSVSFGPKHLFVWAPTLIFAGTGLAFSAILANFGANTFWAGLAAYNTTIGIVTACLGGCLVGTLLLIRHNVNMAAQAEHEEEDWPPLKEKIIRRSIATDDLEALKEGSSWITSHQSSSSRQLSISAFSFSTVHHSNTHQSTHASAPITGSGPSVLPKSSYWFGTATPGSAALISQESIPPVPRVPSPYRDRPSTPPAVTYTDLSDPFHRSPPREPKSSANSWLTSPSVSQVTLSEFSFPTTRPGSPAEHPPATPTVFESEAPRPRPTLRQSQSASRVLGGYGPQDAVSGLSAKANKDVDISKARCVAWIMAIWLPLGLSLPYVYMSSPVESLTSTILPLMLTISVTISSPLLALNVLLGYSLPIPAALFSRSYSPTPVKASRPASFAEVRIHPEMRTRNSSMTVVEGRRSGDVWIARGEAVDGRGKAARVLGMMVPNPRLHVLPFQEKEDGEILTPPLPIHDESAPSLAPSSPVSIEIGMGRSRKDSKASSYYSGAEESLAYKTQIMVAQRHYPARAAAVYLNHGSQPSGSTTPSETNAIASGVERGMTRTHMRTQSASSTTRGHMRTQSASSSMQTPRSSGQWRFPLTPPPSTPLPPTPPNVRALHSRSHSSTSGSGFSFRPIGNTNQIDTLSAGVLPLLIPGLKVGSDVLVKDSPIAQRHTISGRRAETVKSRKKVTPPFEDEEFGFGMSSSFNSPEVTSTPAAKPGKRSGNRWRHMSLPSLGLGKDGVHSLTAWKDELVKVLGNFETRTPSSARNRRTVYGGETGIPPVPTLNVQKSSTGTLSPVNEDLSQLIDQEIEFGYAVTSDDRRLSARSLQGHTPPTSASVYSDGFNTARSSMATMVEQPPNSATALLPRSFNAQQENYNLPSIPNTANATAGRSASPYHLPRGAGKRSSIVYIKSDDSNIPSSTQPRSFISPKPLQPKKNNFSSSVKKLIPKKSFDASNSNSTSESPSPLRKLTLLGNRDLNSPGGSISGSGTPPLSISKKKSRTALSRENSGGLRPLQLARSATAKARALLRQEEVLPQVVVRPPSTSDHGHTGYAYSFQ